MNLDTEYTLDAINNQTTAINNLTATVQNGYTGSNVGGGTDFTLFWIVCAVIAAILSPFITLGLIIKGILIVLGEMWVNTFNSLDSGMRVALVFGTIVVFLIFVLLLLLVAIKIAKKIMKKIEARKQQGQQGKQGKKTVVDNRNIES